MISKTRQWIQYLRREVWQIDIETMPWWKSISIRFLRICLLTKQGFTKSQIQHGASGLTYYTLLAIVPIVALLIGVARGFLFEETFQEWAVTEFSDQKVVINKIFDFANLYLERAKGGWIALFGILILFWSAIKILLNIEWVMNWIWEVRKGRSFARRFSDYLAVIFICPVILFLASGMAVYLTAAVEALSKHGVILKEISPVLLYSLRIIPFLLITLLLTFLYIFMPNTRVRFMPAFIAALVAALFYEVVQEVYFAFQVGVSKYNAVYGTFAALPLFLIWVHISWIIVLLGAKISFSIQNLHAYEFITEDVKLSHKLQTVLSLRIAHLCIKRFCKEEEPPTLIQISNLLSIPIQLTGNLVSQLCTAEVLTEVKKENGDPRFQPAKNVDSLTIKRVLDMIDAKGEEIPLPTSVELSLILKSLEKFGEAIEKSEANILLKEI